MASTPGRSLVRIHKDEWMRYLVWFRDTLHLPVRNDVRLEAVEPRGDCWPCICSARGSARSR